jgi:cell division inhibitor SepF
MGVLDKFLNVMKLNDDYDDDEFFYDDEDEDDTYYEEERPKRKFFQKLEDEEDTYEEPQQSVKRVRQEKPQPKPVRSSNKVTPMRAKKANGGMEVCVIKPSSMEDTREITETLLSNRTVVLNLEGIDVEVAQRIIDFTSGSCYAISGNLQKISNYIFIITPSNVDISGDFPEIINGAFDLPSINSNY